MYPVIGRVGPFVIHSYGLALAVAFLAAFAWIRYECGRRDIVREIAADLVLAAAVGGLAGARLAYVAAHWDYFGRHLVDVVKFQQGGLVFYGGVAGGAAGVALVARLRKLPFGQVADMAAPALALGAAIGRVGCLLNGCCCGRLTQGSLGITFPAPLGGPRFATQAFDGLYNLAIFAALVLISRRWSKLKPGFLFWLYAAVYSIFRFGVEFLRENPILIGGLSGVQIISLCLFAGSAAVLVLKYRRPVEVED